MGSKSFNIPILDLKNQCTELNLSSVLESLIDFDGIPELCFCIIQRYDWLSLSSFVDFMNPTVTFADTNINQGHRHVYFQRIRLNMTPNLKYKEKSKNDIHIKGSTSQLLSVVPTNTAESFTSYDVICRLDRRKPGECGSDW